MGRVPPRVDGAARKFFDELRRLDRRPDPIGDGDCLVDPRIWQEYDELVSKAPPAHKIVRTDRIHQNSADLADQLVALGVAHGVVALQVISIDQAQAEVGSLGNRFRER